MSIDSYDELIKAVGRWIKRRDLVDNIPDFIALFEARANRVLRTQAQRVTATVAVTDNLAPLPAGYLEAITVGDGTDESRFLTALQYGANQPDSGFYAIDGGNIRVSGNTGNLTLSYYAKFPALGPTTATNWLLANAPDAYLFGALVEAEPYMYNDARMAMWKERGDNALIGIQQADDQARFAGGTLSIGHPR